MAMTTEHTDLVQDQQPCPQAGTEQDYRLLEHDYHKSAAYAAMVERYPLLRRTIAACRGKRLVGQPSHLPGSEPQPEVADW